ncbi:MAG: LuxR C-terminal-related transcriptional regulator [Candidatus Limnocylindrales bacterium]
MADEIVAREDELVAVEAFLDRPADGPRALVLEGEAGIGKSTLWLAGVAAARARGFRVLVSRPAETERTLPNVVLGDLFGEVEPDVLAMLPTPRRRAFEAALLLLETPEVPIDARALGVAILTLVPVLAAGEPLILAIDDDQWLDSSSAATLLFALRRLGRAPVRLLLSRRVGVAKVAALEEAIDPSAVERLTIGPLSLGGVQLLLRRRLDVTISRPMLARIHEVSAGNPFYALELGRVQSADRDRDATLPLAVPPSLELLLGARLKALDASTRRALLLVAAHGRLPVDLARAMRLVSGPIDVARSAGVLETDGAVVRFTHPLLASTLYQSATDKERRAAHGQLARFVEDPVDRGRHLAIAANRPNEELAGALELAADVARDRGMAIAAAELAEHARRLTPTEAVGDRHRRAIAAARAHLAAGDGGRARAIADDLLGAAPAGRRRAEALVLRSELEPPGPAVALREEALDEARGSPELQAAIHAALADSGFFSSTRPVAWVSRHARASLRLAERLDDDALRADALSTLALIRFVDRDPQALGLAERAYLLAAPLADPRHVARAIVSVGLVLGWSGRAGAARDWLERRLATWSDRDERVRYEIVSYLALVEFRAGRWDVASTYADEVLDISGQYGIAAPYDLLIPALVELHRGDFQAASANARRALALGEGQHLEFFFGILAMCDLWIGDAHAALANFILAEHAADASGEDEPSMRFWRAEHVEALLQLGRVDDAERLNAEWEAAAHQLGRERVLAQSTHGRGLIALARGDIAAGVAILEHAVELGDAAEDPFGRARALLALGVARRRMRQKRSSRDAIEAALAAFEELGAASWAAAASVELARIGGRQRLEGLSPSELAVAALVAEGRTNREIAAALFLGERTVAGHLTRIYAKLGIHSRTQLARQLRPGAEPSAGDDGKVERS